MYIVIRNFYEGNTLHEMGQVFEHSDQAYVEKCIADKNIADESHPEAAKLVAAAKSVAAIAAEDTVRHDTLQGQVEQTTQPAPTGFPEHAVQPVAPVDPQTQGGLVNKIRGMVQ